MGARLSSCSFQTGFPTNPSVVVFRRYDRHYSELYIYLGRKNCNILRRTSSLFWRYFKHILSYHLLAKVINILSI